MNKHTFGPAGLLPQIALILIVDSSPSQVTKLLPTDHSITSGQSWWKNSRRPACRCARRCEHRRNRAAPATGWPAAARYGSCRSNPSDAENAGTGMPCVTPSATISRHAAWLRLSKSVKNGSSIRLVRSGSRWYASVMRFKKRARMMQPPRHILAMPPRSRSQSCDLADFFDQVHALSVADDLRGIQSVVHLLHQFVFGQIDDRLRPFKFARSRHALIFQAQTKCAPRRPR